MSCGDLTILYVVIAMNFTNNTIVMIGCSSCLRLLVWSLKFEFGLYYDVAFINTNSLNLLWLRWQQNSLNFGVVRKGLFCGNRPHVGVFSTKGRYGTYSLLLAVLMGHLRHTNQLTPTLCVVLNYLHLYLALISRNTLYRIYLWFGTILIKVRKTIPLHFALNLKDENPVTFYAAATNIRQQTKVPSISSSILS